jgi:EAL domain-containing protein (putative c-di-GMP-specific phosphodiesterase class I)
MEHSDIRELLEKITADKEFETLKLENDQIQIRRTYYQATGKRVALIVNDNEYKFLAASPAIVRQLLDEVERLTAKNERLHTELKEAKINLSADGDIEQNRFNGQWRRERGL